MRYNDSTEQRCQSILKEKYKLNNMQNGILTLTWENVKGALVSGVITGVVLGILAMLGYILQVGDLFGLDWKVLINTGAMAAISGLVAGVSVIKNLLTTNSGNFLGTTKIVSDIE